MSDASDKVRGVRELPLFPLPLVLFPGVPLPLHIFEPRYQRLLSDIRAHDSLFGLSYFDQSESPAHDEPHVRNHQKDRDDRAKQEGKMD